MTVARFYVSTKELCEGRLPLKGDEHHHMSRVLRMRRGQELTVLDGKGLVGRATITEIGSSKSLIGVAELIRVEKEGPGLHLYQALPKGKKMDHIVQYAVEMGACSLTPFFCRRSQPLTVSGRERLERWHKVALETSRLAGHAYLPEIRGLLSWEEVLEGLSDVDAAIFADDAGGERPSVVLGDGAPGELVCRPVNTLAFDRRCIRYPLNVLSKCNTQSSLLRRYTPRNTSRRLMFCRNATLNRDCFVEDSSQQGFSLRDKPGSLRRTRRVRLSHAPGGSGAQALSVRHRIYEAGY